MKSFERLVLVVLLLTSCAGLWRAGDRMSWRKDEVPCGSRGVAYISPRGGGYMQIFIVCRDGSLYDGNPSP